MSVNFAMAEKKSLSNYLWENRLLIISFEKGDNEVKNSTNEYIKKNQCQFDDRNLKVIFLKIIKILIIKLHHMLIINLDFG